MAETQPEEHEVTSPTIPEHRGMAESQPEEPEVTSPTVPPSIPSPSTATPDEDMPVDDEDPVYDGDNDGDYVDDHGDDGAADSSTSGDDVDAEDEHIQAQISAFSKQLFAKKREAQKTKPKRLDVGDLRSEIQDAYEVPPVAKVAKRKPADGDGAESSQSAKRPKATLGGLKPNWQKELGLPKPVKKSPTSWNRSVSRTSSTTSATTRTSATSAGEEIHGEFEVDEDPEALRGARARKEPAASGTIATTKMGIILRKKAVVVDVNGKTKRETKRRYTNADLPFPADSHAVDLKHFQKTFIPDIIDWVGTLDDPFAATSHPSFEVNVQDTWQKYFTAYPISDAVEYMAVSAIRNWRSDIGKRALKAVSDHLKSDALQTARSRREWVAEQAQDIMFVYREPATKGGSYRSDLLILTFVAHLRIVIKNDVSFGHPTGAMSICCAAVERALQLCKNGSPSPEGVPRPGKKNYLKPIKTLSLQKWSEIFALTVAHLDKSDPMDDIFSTDGDSSEGYIDPRSCVVVSDDEPEEDGDEAGSFV
ncbi:hypothetical protein B0H10DRAFT_2249255 [Mycena sp. CBHHK59/15]|nr:hypothetical protein B0H10DRAFT_2249255 [Mycena sp. CBHHK59/15]